MSVRMIRSMLLLLSALFLSSAEAVDVKRFELIKGIHYFQIADGISQLQTNNAYRFTVQVYADAVGDVLGSSVFTPKIPHIDLLPDKDGDPYRFRDKFDDRGSLENDFPNGTYQLAIRGFHDGDRTMSFAVAGDSYPSAPVVNDYAGLQKIVYNEYNEISWQPFAGGATTDFMQVQIEDLNGNNIWETPDFGESGALDGLAMRTILPPRTLSPGVVYVATIRFVKVLFNSSASYPGARGTVGYYARTEFTIRPQSIGLEPVVDRLQVWRKLQYEQSFDGELRAEVYPWEFESRLDTVASNQVTAVDLAIPGWTNSVSFMADDPTEFDYSLAVLLTKEDFLTMFPNGAYTFDVHRADGATQRAVVNLPGGDFPAVPVLRGYQTYTNHPGGEDLVVTWDPWVEASDPDFIRVELSDERGKIWDTSSYASAKHLHPNETTVTIPGTNFIAGHEMRLDVRFFHVNLSETRVIPGGLVFGGFETRTKLDFTNQLPDVVTFRAAEGQYFWQRGTNRVEADPISAYRFEAIANAARTNAIRNAQITTPLNETLQLSSNATTEIFKYTGIEESSSSLAQRYPAGAYRMRFDTALDGIRNVSIELPPTELPPVPRIVLNFNKIFRIVPSGDSTIGWAPWVGANTNTDSIRVTVENLNGLVIIDSATASTNHTLIATSTNFTFLGPRGQAAAELKNNQSYIARLRFERGVKFDPPEYPGAHGTAAVFSELAFYVSTFSPSYLASFTNSVSLANGLVQINVPATSATPFQKNRPYTLFQTHDLTNWSIAKVEALTVPFFQIPPPDEPTFYKAAILP